MLINKDISHVVPVSTANMSCKRNRSPSPKCALKTFFCRFLMCKSLVFQLMTSSLSLSGLSLLYLGQTLDRG
uniref:Uncharacterized protein n=1 Tax=Anguilla anguilla TaxID=7936 RepID=A0A0E9XSU3_ANGAN